jgi:extracellular factor (EF) 3-hydroxypalmitic acid methyl ester biosynthesis protein
MARQLVNNLKGKIDDFSRFLKLIVEKEPGNFEKEFHDRLNYINQLSLLCPEERPYLMENIISIAPEVYESIFHNRSWYKPLGYSGDYQIIDWIYTKKTGSPGFGKMWDEFFHRQEAPKAVRNRKAYFSDIFKKLGNPGKEGKSVLNLACGPCRDVAEAVKLLDFSHPGILLHLVDYDFRAIAYAQEVVGIPPQGVDCIWQKKNVLRLRTDRTYDLVWSGGLFDYLDDRQASFLIARMWEWAKSGGNIIFGNFHPRNPSRNYMEWIGRWFLIYRTEDQMRRLCQMAGINLEFVTIEQEPLGVCIFCVISKP